MLNEYKNFFSDEKIWLKNRDKTFFKSIEEAEEYQKNRLYFLGFDSKKKPFSKIPALNKNVENITMRRSGTTSVSSNREYSYSIPEYGLVEQHHIWKLEKSNNLSEPGDVVWICSIDEKSIIPKLYGPVNSLNLGKHNNCYVAYHNNVFGKLEWRQILKLIKNLNPKFVRTSPSTIQIIYYLFQKEFYFDCPVILSEETLHDHTKEMAKLIFKDVIDKMVSWDGCLGWFECQFKTKHIYDEFCYVEQLPDKTLISTDLNNRAMNFHKYMNGDKGVIEKKVCECGLAGTYFKEFNGKTIESLYVGNDIKEIISGRFISERLSMLIRTGSEFGDSRKGDSRKVLFPENFIYRIKQKIDLEIDFIYSSEKELDLDLVLAIKNMLNRIIWNNRNCRKINFIREDFEKFQAKENRRSKSLFIESDFLKNRFKKIL